MKYFNNIKTIDELDRVYDLLSKDNPESKHLLEEYNKCAEKILTRKKAFIEGRTTKKESYDILMSNFFKIERVACSEVMNLARETLKKINHKMKRFKIISSTGKDIYINLIPDKGIDIIDGNITYTTTRYGLTGWWSKGFKDQIILNLNSHPIPIRGRIKNLDTEWWSWDWNGYIHYDIKYKFRRNK